MECSTFREGQRKGGYMAHIDKLYTPALRRPNLVPPTKALPELDWLTKAAAGAAAKMNTADWSFIVYYF
jgi:hypothetical protein